jgi:hypothetical protein
MKRFVHTSARAERFEQPAARRPELSPQAVYLCKARGVSREWDVSQPFLNRRTRNEKCNLSGGKRVTGLRKPILARSVHRAFFVEREITEKTADSQPSFDPGCPYRVEMDVRARRDQRLGKWPETPVELTTDELAGGRPETLTD